MKNQVNISSSHPEIILRAEALVLKNSFLEMGFKKRAAFVDIVCEYFDKYKNQKGVAMLQGWWNGRAVGVSVNADVELVINKLENE